MRSKLQRPPVSGARIFLRHPALSDADEFIASARQSVVFHRGLVGPPRDLKGFRAFLRRNESDTNECLLICLRDTSEIAGAITLSQIFYGPFENAYLGYYLFVKYVGNGYMTEGIRMVLKYAFQDIKLHRLEANVQPKNRDSIAVVKRCGFTREGFSRKYLKIGDKWCDHERWAILREDWLSLPK